MRVQVGDAVQADDQFGSQNETVYAMVNFDVDKELKSYFIFYGRVSGSAWMTFADWLVRKGLAARGD